MRRRRDGSGGTLSSSTSSRRTKRLLRTPSTEPETSFALLDELLAQRGPTRGAGAPGRASRAQATEDVPAAADARSPSARYREQELVSDFLPQRDLARERRREAAVARSGRSSGGCRPVERARALRSRASGLQHRAHDVRGHAEPVDQRDLADARSRARRVGLRRGSARAHARRRRRVLGEDPRRARAAGLCGTTGSRSVEDEREDLVVRLEQLRAARRARRRRAGSSAGDPRVERQIVVAPRDRRRVKTGSNSSRRKISAPRRAHPRPNARARAAAG